MIPDTMKTTRLLVMIAILGAIVTAQVTVSYPYEAASYVSQPHSHALVVFPSKGKPVTIPVPFQVDGVTFAPDGKSIYGFIRDNQEDFDPLHPLQAGLSKIEFCEKSGKLKFPAVL